MTGEREKPNRLEIAKAIVPLLAYGQKNVDSLIQDVAKKLNCENLLKIEMKNKKENILRYEMRWALTGLKFAGFITPTQNNSTSSKKNSSYYILTDLGKKALDPNFDWTPYNEPINSRKARVENPNSNNEENDEKPGANQENCQYTDSHFLEEVYISSDDLYRILQLLDIKRNLMLQGPPGVGKTFMAERLAFVMMGEKNRDCIKKIQFHQNYGYEDFLIGLKPLKTGGFWYEEGPFYEFCRTASENPDKKYFFIIDEINRGNVSRIFGEVLMLIERSHRGETVTLMYDHRDFTIPENIYLIGTMNTADRSLAIMDYALRRRFAFYDVRPQLSRIETSDPAIKALITKTNTLNEEISKDSSLGPGFEIGHSYFLEGLKAESIVENNLIPLLNEYWFDRQDRIDYWKKELRHLTNDTQTF